MADVLERLKAALADRYRIERELGSGGMATVYLAEDLKHHRQVAIKVLRPELAASLGVERFVREIEIAANLTHPHILPLHDSGEADGFLYYVMPFIKGESLRERIDREEKLDIKEAIRLTDQVASALSHAHELGLVHRDIKPENILLAADQAIVADFGIARAVEVAGGERLTGTGLAVGTPAYMSPEQAVGDKNVDARSDVYALGCVVYEMVTGRAPFEGATPQEMLAKHAVDTVPGLRTSDPSIPLFLERAVDRALAKRPDERFQSASAFAEALTSEIVVARVGRRRSPWLAVSGAAIVLLVAAALVLMNVLGGPAYERLAVLPPANLMNDPEQEYFVQGVHTALISELQRAGVAVIARTSVLQYENTQKPIREIASELGVDALIEASVLRAADSVEIEARLVDGMTEQYVADPIVRRGEFRDVVALYRDLTGAIASEIQAALTPQAEARLASARPVNPEAYDAYLKGSYHWQQLTREDLDVAERYFELALEKDPSYAPAYEGLAWVWAVRQQRNIVLPDEAGPKARAAALRAIELDDSSAGAHEALAVVRTWTDWDWAGAEPEWRRALELDPTVANTHAYFAQFLAITGRADEAIPHSERALELDPFNPLYQRFYAGVLCSARRFDDAMAAARGALGNPGGELECAFVSKGMRDEHVALQRERLARGDPERLAAFDEGLAEAGYEGAMRRVADLLAARYERSGGVPDPGAEMVQSQPAYIIAVWYLWAGDYERTVDWLERAFEVREPNLPYLGFQPYFDPLRSDPRFQELLRRVGLPQ